MPTTKTVCPFCGQPAGVPLVYGDYEHLAEGVRAQVDLDEVVCGGDAVAIDEAQRVLNMACQSCGHEWHAPTANVTA